MGLAGLALSIALLEADRLRVGGLRRGTWNQKIIVKTRKTVFRAPQACLGLNTGAVLARDLSQICRDRQTSGDL